MTDTPIFKKKTRVNKELANEGIWTKIYDETGDQYGNFKIVFFDETSERVRNSFKRLRALNNKYKANNDEETAGIMFFVEMVLRDWADVLDHNDEQVPFSVENAVAFFSDEDNAWIMAELQKQAFSSANFKTDEIEKNSETASAGKKKS